MPQINGMTLMMAIQAVDAKIAEIEDQLDNDDSPEADELEPLLLSYMKAASALKTAYDEALESTSNLPPYSDLVRAD